MYMYVLMPWGIYLPYCDVEDVTADRTGDSHIAETFLGHDHTRNEVRDARASRQKGQPHYLINKK